MQSDFYTRCKSARELIPVPSVPLGKIRAAVALPTVPTKRRWAFGATLAGVSIIAVAGAAVWETSNVHVESNGALVLKCQSAPGKRRPTEDDLQDAVRNAGFKAVLPAGLPEGTTASTLMNCGRSAIAISYNLPGESRRYNHLLWTVLVDTKAAGTPKDLPATIRLPISKGRWGVAWVVGAERVYLDAPTTLTKGDVDRMKAAMEQEL